MNLVEDAVMILIRFDKRLGILDQSVLNFLYNKIDYLKTLPSNANFLR